MTAIKSFQIRTAQRRRSALSLLEVILAISILAMTAAVLAQIIKNGTDNALDSRDALQASLICESKLAEVAAGGIAMQSTSWVAVTDQVVTTRQWFYRIDATQATVPDIMSVTVFVADEYATQNQTRPTARLTRWFVNPALNLDAPAAADPAADAASGSGAPL